MSSKEFSHKQALVLLTQEICSQLDELARLKKRGMAASVSEHVFREVCGTLRELPAEMQEQYFDYLMTFTEVLSLPAEQERERETEAAPARTSKKLKRAMKAIAKVA